LPLSFLAARNESSFFAAASTNEIARRANSSKTTIYSRFPTKEQLFRAVIERRLAGNFPAAGRLTPGGTSIDETLRHYGATLIRIALSKKQLALVRVINMELAKSRN